MIVAELMTPKPVTVAPSDTLKAAHERMEAGRFRQVPVVDEERLVGILTDRDTRLLMTNKIGSLPVVEDGKLVGIITATDMLRALEAVLGAASEGSSRIDLDLSGSGEIAAATSLVRTICPLLGVGTYQRKQNHPEREILYVLVPSTSAQRAAQALKEYGFKVIAIHY